MARKKPKRAPKKSPAPKPKKRPTPKPKKRPAPKPKKRPAPKLKKRPAPKPKKLPAPKPKKRKAPRPPPPPRGTLRLTRRQGLLAVRAVELVLVVGGGIRDLPAALEAVSLLGEALRPVAARSTGSDVLATGAAWTFKKRPVDPDSILQALVQTPARAVSVPAPLTLSLGVVDDEGRYWSLAHRSRALPDSAAEEDVTRERTREKYRERHDASNRRRRAVFYELEAA